MNKELDKYFLPADDEDDDFTFLLPVRADSVVQPLVDGIETFQAMATAIAAAKRHVNIAAWVLNPALKLVRSVRVGDQRVYRWRDLFRELANDGVTVRIIISDFDPVLQNNLHQAAWMAYAGLIKQIDRLPSNRRHHLQVICSRHEAMTEFFAERILNSPRNPRLPAIVKRLNNFKRKSRRQRFQEFANSPGLWSYIQYLPKEKKKPFKLRKEIDYVVYLGSHHQKVCSVDGKVGFLGGLDIQTSRYDNNKHTGMLWHDIHCRLEGRIVKDMDRNFQARWDREVGPYLNFVARANSFSTAYSLRRNIVGLYIEEDEQEEEEDQKGQATKAGGARKNHAQIHRTLSENATFGVVPRTLRKDILEAYEKAIGAANSFVYIENQYVRSLEIAEFIVERHQQVPGLIAIIVLPVAPEEVKSATIDRVTNHGLFLQNRALNLLKTELGNNAGIYSLAARKRYTGKQRAVVTYDSLQVYVHSKMMIVDDLYCHIGTANTNPRSFLVDTEIGVGWYGKSAVRSFRLKLWRELLGNPKNLAGWKPERYVYHWNTVADMNARSAPGKRSGFVIPHDIDRYRGVEDDDIPDEFAGILDAADTESEEVALA